MKKFLVCAACLILAGVFILSCSDTQAESNLVELSSDSLIKRGDYLVTVMGCDDCHSPKVMGPYGPQPDEANRFAGNLTGSPVPPMPADSAKGWVLFSMDQTLAIGPWGRSYAANISSDDTGIGNWSEEQFANAMRKGKYKGLENARTLLPPMPWENFAKLSDLDLRAIFAYLKSSKPVANVVKESGF